MTSTAVQVREQVLWLQLTRPEVLNAISADMVEDIHRALDRASRPDVRAIVVTGTGRAFSAGADLQELPGETIDVERLEAVVHRVDDVVERLATVPKPVVAGVNGLAAGGGLEIVLACDIVVAATGARFADAHVNYGLLPGAGGSYRLPRRVGPSLARRLMLTGEFMTAEELVACGLVTRVVEPDDLEPTLAETASALASRSPRVLAAMKRLIDGADQLDDGAAAEAERAALHAHLQTADLVEGLSAFRAGRRPVFADELETDGQEDR